MIADTDEVKKLLKEAPRGIITLIANNLGLERSKVNNELRYVRDVYNEEIVNELKRLVEAIKPPENKIPA